MTIALRLSPARCETGRETCGTSRDCIQLMAQHLPEPGIYLQGLEIFGKITSGGLQ